MNHRTILVTGASGFVGATLCNELTHRGFGVRKAVRLGTHTDDPGCYGISDITHESAWWKALLNVDTVIHLIARTHMLDDTSADPLAAYRHINVLGTTALAHAAVTAGVRRMIFLSSIKVNGESTTTVPYSENDVPKPEDGYGISKWEAERELLHIAKASALQTVILRPPLIYGPGVKGNLLRLLGTIARGVPLPLASVQNQRSLIYLGNLVDAIAACIDAPTVVGKTYLVSDGVDLSTPMLIRKLAAGLEITPRLLPFPVALLNGAARLLGKESTAMRITGSLQVDSSRIQHDLGWQPKFTPDQGLSATGQWYRRAQNSS